MKNIKYLKENNLYEAHKHFMRLSETFIPEIELSEAGEEEQDPNAAQDQMAGGDPNMGADPMAGGGGMPQDPNAMGADPMAAGDPNMMGDPNADPMAGGGGMPQDPNAMGADPMMGDPMMDDPNSMEEEPEDDGETIDIDGLTHAEEKLNIKQNQIGRDLSKVDRRIFDLIKTIGNLQQALDNNNSELEALKAEFEKRNPTQTEKLNLRSLDSYPFNVKPTDYWKNEAENGGYQTYADNSEPTTKEYVITNNDVDNPVRNIADTFSIDDDDIQTLNKLFGL